MGLKRQVRLLCFLGFAFGALLLNAALSACMCPAQIVGQPYSCSCALHASQELWAGLAVVLASAAALGLSFVVKPKAARAGA
ncbi:MAG: hypothetical protein JRN56_03885 [Nitrososphaerota archaeon]|nr:hypothetical protein [Nitrososphaerota archaeon]MDG6937167.1 hypothetical protein [Nitrososphaerota archaeon]MDG6961819.1 hypothetical protein [Nitrososphaerota archaeon]MDG6962490.1 hypothetical protein [Nitrososphaerota archaeon]MDG6972409.1 hypothetical protein [Nitrososphaerota archaeon]